MIATLLVQLCHILRNGDVQRPHLPACEGLAPGVRGLAAQVDPGPALPDAQHALLIVQPEGLPGKVDYRLLLLAGGKAELAYPFQLGIGRILPSIFT